MWKIVPLALLLESSCGLFLLYARVVVLPGYGPIASSVWDGVLEE